MRGSIDFLPPSHRRAIIARRAVRSRVLLALLVLLGAVLTEASFRWRAVQLERVAELAEDHAREIASRAARAADFEDQHVLFTAELERWTRPLDLPAATSALEALLRATPPEIELERLRWSHELLAEVARPPRLELAGAAADAHALAAWLRALEAESALPGVELESSQRSTPAAEGALHFRVRTPTDRRATSARGTSR